MRKPEDCKQQAVDCFVYMSFVCALGQLHVLSSRCTCVEQDTSVSCPAVAMLGSKTGQHLTTEAHSILFLFWGATVGGAFWWLVVGFERVVAWLVWCSVSLAPTQVVGQHP